MRHVIGLPGEKARLRAGSLNEGLAIADPGEVVVPFSGEGEALISADGMTAVDMPLPTGWAGDYLRSTRNILLGGSDWPFLPRDPSEEQVPEEVKAVYGAYRQALRDLPETQPDATTETIIWPSPPE